MSYLGSPALLMKHNTGVSPAPHQILLSRYFVAAVTSPLQEFLDAEIPVRHGKTTILSKAGMLWAILNWPERNFLVTSSSDDLLTEIGTYLQDGVRLIGPRIGVGIRKSKSALNHWMTNKGGEVMVTTTGTAFQGKGFFIISIDDPYASAEMAMSEKRRGNMALWYDGSVRDRLDPDGMIGLTMARWHEDDLAAHATAQTDPWTILRLPAIAEPDLGETGGPEWRDVMGRKEGEPLWPEARPLEELLRMKANNPDMFQAKYQQMPYNIEGDEFPVGQWRTVDMPAPMHEYTRLVRAWDLAATRDGGDWSVGLLLGLHYSGIHVIHETRFREGPDEVRRQMLDTANGPLDQGAWVAWEEGKAHLGKFETESLQTLLLGKVAVPQKMGDKEEKSRIVQTQQRAGRIVLCKSGIADVEAFKMEFTKGKKGRHDDRIDTLAVGLVALGVDDAAVTVTGASQVADALDEYDRRQQHPLTATDFSPYGPSHADEFLVPSATLSPFGSLTGW